jgi:hypothetical protein
METGKAAEMLLDSIPHGMAIDTDKLTAAYMKALETHPENEAKLDQAFETLWNFKGKFPAATPAENKTSETSKTSEFPKELTEGLAALEGVDPKVCGTWLWLHGSTAGKEAVLRSLGCKFGKKKQMWYWSPPGSKKRRRKGGMSYGWITSKYGEKDLEAAA